MTTTSRGGGAGNDCQLARRMSLLVAQSGHGDRANQRPLSGASVGLPESQPHEASEKPSKYVDGGGTGRLKLARKS
jgi:hypothetical protein